MKDKHNHHPADQQQHEQHHHHSPEHLKAVSNRLARAIGHLESIKRMVEEDRDCSDILIQLMAVKAAINNTGKVILKEHMEHCLVHAIEEGDFAAIDEFNKAIERFL
jgi:DNA-binding FrmR family transcriptional regulator